MLGLERPPTAAIAALVTLTAANAALFGYLGTRDEPVDTASSAYVAGMAPPTPSSAAPATPAAPSPTTAPAPAEPVLAVYGDGYSTGSTAGGMGAAGWPARVAEEVGGELRLNAVSMSGYSAVGTNGQDFSDIASASPVPDADVTIVFGSRNDLGATAAAVGAGATETFQSIRSAAPYTRLLVVGPSWSSAEIPADLYALRDAVQRAAAAADATFVDPLAEGWFQDPAGLIAADGISPTDQGHAFLATRIATVTEQVLAAE